MSGAAPPFSGEPPSPAERLDSWKEVAAYLKRSVRTVRRWEVEQGLPVHRHLHQSSGTVYAFKGELDRWWASRVAELEATTEEERVEPVAPSPRRWRHRTTWLIGAAVAGVAVLIFPWGGRFGAHTTPSRVMLAVLPLDNLSGQPTQDYFSDGLTEEIITNLGRLNPQRLGVIARTSVLRYRHAKAGIDEIGRELHVDYVLEGSIRSQQDRVRVTAQLVRVSDQTHVWADSYDSTSQDVLGLQADVAEAVSRAIEIALTPEAETELRVTTSNRDAYEAYLMGRYFWNNRTSGTLKQALQYFERATQIDPKYAEAYAGLANCYVMLPIYTDMADRDAEPKAEAAATKALQLDPSLGEVFATLAIVRWSRWEWAEAESNLRHAIELRPNYVTAYQWYADYLQQVGRLREAAAQIDKAKELDPISVLTNSYAAFQLYLERRYDEAIAQSNKVVEMEPRRTDFRNRLGLAFMAKGMFKEAADQFGKTRELDPDDPAPIGWLGTAYAMSGQRQEARKLLQELDGFVRRGRPRSGFYAALVHIALGETDLGFDLLNQSVDEHIGEIGWLKTGPMFDNLRADPRYELLLKRMNFPTD